MHPQNGIRLSSLVAAALMTAAAAAAPTPSTLTKDGRALLAIAIAGEQKEVSVILLANTGKNAEVVSRIEQLGGQVKFREDAVDYLRAMVPTSQVDTLAASPNITLFSVVGKRDERDFDAEEKPANTGKQKNGRLSWDKSVAGESTQLRAKRVQPPTADSPPEAGYLPLHRMGVTQLLKAHPTFDGRGVVVAVVEGSIDPMTPELQKAKTLKGKEIPKFLDFLPSTFASDGDSPTWVTMKDVVKSESGKIAFNSKTYTAPREGEFRIGQYDERKMEKFTGGSPGAVEGGRNDANCDGNPEGSSPLFAVLWDEKTNTVWVDTDQDLSFVGEKELTDFGAKPVYGTFGKDDPATAMREVKAFSVATDRANSAVHIGLLSGWHGTMVGSTVAGHNYLGGPRNGMAPGAGLISIETGRSGPEKQVPALAEGLIIAARDPRVDLMTMSWSGGTPVVDTLVDRLILTYGKQIVSSGSNSGPTMGTMGRPARSRYNIAAGTYIPKETWWANMGLHVPLDGYITGYSARGPSDRGGLKPDFLGLTQVLSSSPQSSPDEGSSVAWLASTKYSAGGGTSQAAPSIAGAIAVLVSAAKQSGVSYDPLMLRQAMRAGAERLPQYAPYEQGYGVVRVDTAWEKLRKMKAKPLMVDVSAPVRTVLSERLGLNDGGIGLFEREGWRVGDKGTRTMIFTRRNGPKGTLTYPIRLLSNDGTFTTAKSIALPLDQPVPLTVNIAPTTLGVHSAIVELADTKEDTGVFSTLLTVIAADQFSAANQFTLRHEGQAERPDAAHYYFYVPPGVDALTTELEITEGDGKLTVMSPEITPTDRGSNDRAGVLSGPGRIVRSFENPQSGVWELIVDSDYSGRKMPAATPNPLPPTKFVLKASVAKASVSAAAGSTQVRATNQMAPIEGRVVAEFASQRSQSIALSPTNRRQVIEFKVPENTDRFDVKLAVPQGASADVDVYLIDSTGKKPELKASANGPTGNETLTLYLPKAGDWKAVVELVTADASVTATYTDVWTPGQMSQNVADRIAPRASSAQWSSQIAPWKVSADWAPDGRTPVMVLSIQDPGIARSNNKPIVLGTQVVPLTSTASAAD